MQNRKIYDYTHEGVQFMNTFFGSLFHILATANKIHIIWCAAILLVMMLLAVLHHRWRDDAKKIKLWRFLCLIPPLIAAVHFLIYCLSFPLIAADFTSLYIMAALAVIPIPFAKRKIGYRITASLTGIVIVMCGIYFSAQSPNFYNYTGESYTGSFRSMIRTMDKTYVLKEWKETDFVALEAKYLPMVQEAEQEQNPAKFADAVAMFCNELHDGHVWIQSNYDEEAYPSAPGLHEYGLAMVQLDSGEVIAVCTVEDVNQLGIEDGTIITKWNGKPVLQAAKEDVADQGFPVKSNADRIAVINLSGVGGETVDVTFLDKDGKEQTVTLPDLGKMHTLREALLAFSNEPDIKTDDDVREYLEKNFSTRMLDDKCGYLFLNAEETDNEARDTLSYLNGDHKWAREMFREKLRDLRSQGMEYLVIDLRNNRGGYDVIGCALCDLLTAEDWYGEGLGIRKNGQYICVADHVIHGDGEFADLQVVALTNYNCASAGDGTALYLSKLPNVTLAGITDPNGCNQEIGGICALSGGVVYVCYPTGLILDENNVPNVDTRADRISRNPVEVRIPLDYDAAMMIFRDKLDYELEWAVKFLEE